MVCPPSVSLEASPRCTKLFLFKIITIIIFDAPTFRIFEYLRYISNKKASAGTCHILEYKYLSWVYSVVRKICHEGH